MTMFPSLAGPLGELDANFFYKNIIYKSSKSLKFKNNLRIMQGSRFFKT